MSASPSSGPVTISIIVPVCESDGDPRACFEGIGVQRFDAERIEVIAVAYGERPPPLRSALPDFRIYETGRASPYAARNLGASHAKGDVLLFTESNCVPDADWVAAHLRCLSEGPASISVGHVAPAQMTSPLEMFSAYEEQRDAWVFSGSSWRHYFGRPKNMAITRTRFETHGPFREVARGADSELVQLVARDLSCEQIELAPDAIVRLRKVTGFASCLGLRFADSRAMQRHRSSHAAPIALRERARILGETLRQRNYGPARAACLVLLLCMGILAFRLGGWAGKVQGNDRAGAGD